MKLYHIDREGHLYSGLKVNLVKDFYNDKTNNEYYKDGLSSHGLRYYLADVSNKDYAIDVIFEYERMINFKDKLSRYQALYAFDLDGTIEFINNKLLNDNFYKIYEINTKKYERHDMNLVRGWSHCTISNYAKLYWSDSENPDKSKKPQYEYLVKLPVKIGKEVSYNKLLEEYNKKYPKEEDKK